MSDHNPYQTPLSDVTPLTDTVAALAGRGRRFVAGMVDGLLSLLLVIPLMYLTGAFEDTMRGFRSPMWLTVVTALIGFLIFVALHYVPLSRNGQTIGKKLLGIRIADMEGNKPPLSTILLKRYLPISIISVVPLVGQLLPLVDVLFIFRKDRRCLHDLIAGTQVLRVTE